MNIMTSQLSLWLTTGLGVISQRTNFVLLDSVPDGVALAAQRSEIWLSPSVQSTAHRAMFVSWTRQPTASSVAE